jgi:hypothetical protein
MGGFGTRGGMGGVGKELGSQVENAAVAIFLS